MGAAVLFLETLSSSAEGLPCSQGHWMADLCLCTQSRPTQAPMGPRPTGSNDNTEGRNMRPRREHEAQGSLAPSDAKPDS